MGDIEFHCDVGSANAYLVHRVIPAITAASVARGAFGSPTLFVGEEMFFGKDQLRDVEAEVLRRG